jgi:hypothetical protein
MVDNIETAKSAAALLLPPREGIHYLEHQEAGIRWMLEREDAETAKVCRGGVLADDMGLGKTFQTIGLLKNSPYALRTLIVCPPALLAGWTEELRACGYHVCRLVEGTGSWAAVPAAAEGRTVWLVTYPKVTMYRRACSAAADGVTWGRVILDEGHIIRNGPATSRWMACMAIAKAATCRWILSATPVQNGQDDWRHLCWWLRVRGVASADMAGLAPLLMLRRTMAELRGVMEELPPAPRYVSHELTVPEGSKEAALFRALCDQLEGAIESRAVSALMKLELYMRIQQFLVHPQMYVEAMRDKFGVGAYPRPDWSGGATKWEAFLAELRAGVAARESQIVFCQFRREMTRVAGAAAALGATVFEIRGGIGTDRIGENVAAARAAAGEGEPVVVVVQIVSGGAGLNLQFCTRVLFLSLHWNPAVVHQAVGRAVRIGQRRVVEVHLFRVVDAVADNLDRRMVDVHLAKIGGAKEICSSLYAGYENLEAAAEGFEEVEVVTEGEEEEEEEDPCEVHLVDE